VIDKKVMANWKRKISKVLFYLILFFLSFLVFESFSLVFAVGIALFALYFFTSKKSSSN